MSTELSEKSDADRRYGSDSIGCRTSRAGRYSKEVNNNNIIIDRDLFTERERGPFANPRGFCQLGSNCHWQKAGNGKKLAWLAIARLRRNCNGVRNCSLQFQSCPPIQINLAIPNWKSSPALEMHGVLENFQSARLFSLTRFFSMRTHRGVRIVKAFEKNLAGAGCQNLTSPVGFTAGRFLDKPRQRVRWQRSN